MVSLLENVMKKKYTLCLVVNNLDFIATSDVNLMVRKKSEINKYLKLPPQFNHHCNK